MISNLLKQSVENLLVDAYEGHGLDYWADVRNPEYAPNIVSLQVRPMESGKGFRRMWYKITPERILFARKKMFKGSAKVRRDIAAQFIGQEWDTDQEGVDAMIQIICFNKIVFA